jgi:hypothetical protein
VYVLGGKVFQYRNIFPDVIPVGIGLSAEFHWTIAMKKLLEEGRTAQPKPHAGIHTPIGVK